MHDIKKVGDYVATVHFHKEVMVEIPVKVVDENASAEVSDVVETSTEEANVETPATEEAPAAE